MKPALTSLDFYKKFGHPEKLTDIIMWDVPTEIEVGVIPKKIYCNKAMVDPLMSGFINLINRNKVEELKTWDGCFNFRPIRGYEKQYNELIKKGLIEQAMKYVSIHSWGCAFDCNASWNQLKQVPTLTPEFVACFTDAGFDWGGNFKRLDGMHFQLKSI